MTERDLGARALTPDTRMRAMLRPSNQQEILQGFSDQDQKTIQYRQQVLSSLASFVGKDFRIPVKLSEPGEGWYWDFAADEIGIDPKDLVGRPFEECRFIVSHEGGHKRISRMEGIPLEVWRQPGFSFMMNYIEDPRVNNFVAESYPKFKSDMEQTYHADLEFENKAKMSAKDKLGFQPRFVQAAVEYLKQWFRDVEADTSPLTPDLPDDVKEVVSSTLESARDSWLRYPSRSEADKGEEIIKQYAQVSYEINRDEIWPKMQELIEKDIRDIQTEEFLKDLQNQSAEGQDEGEGTGSSPSLPQDLQDQLTQEQQQAVSQAMQDAKESGDPIDLSSIPDEAKQKIQDHINAQPKDISQELMERAIQIIKEFEKELNEMLAGKLSDDPEKKAQREEAQQQTQPTTPDQEETTTPIKRNVQPEQAKGLREYRDIIERAVNQNENVYERERRKVLPIIDSLESDLREIFTARRANKWDSGHRSGKRVNITKRMQEKAKGIPAVESKAWQRKELPDEKSYAITLLIDLSGSMEGDKIEETFKGAIVLAEALNRLSIKTEILGFNDRIYEYQNYGQLMSQAIRAHMGGMLQEVSDTSDSGKARYNDDGWALTEASARLARQKDASEKFLVVLSDGLPAESRMHPRSDYELSSVIKGIQEGSNQKLIGLGIGEGTEHVGDYYPNSISNIGVEEMSQNLADVIREAIANYDSF